MLGKNLVRMSANWLFTYIALKKGKLYNPDAELEWTKAGPSSQLV